MEIINKTHQIFKKENTSSATISFLRCGDITFSVGARDEYNIRLGSFVHFAKENKEVYCFFNDDSNGFLIQDDGTRYQRVRTHAISVIRWMQEVSNYDPTVTFYLQRTEKKQDNWPLFKIAFDLKPVKQIGKE